MAQKEQQSCLPASVRALGPGRLMNAAPIPACAIMATKEGAVLAANRQEQEQAMAAARPETTMIRRQSAYSRYILHLILASQAS